MFTSVFNEPLQRDVDVRMTEGVRDRYVRNTYVLDVPLVGVTDSKIHTMGNTIGFLLPKMRHLRCHVSE